MDQVPNFSLHFRFNRGFLNTVKTTRKILLVDDEPDIAKVTEFILKNSGYAVITSSDGALGLDRVRAEKPDLILLDLNIPTMTGKEVCRTLKSDEKLRNIPVIILSASTENIQRKAMEIGADDYLVKPYESDEMLKKKGSFFNKTGEIDEKNFSD